MNNHTTIGITGGYGLTGQVVARELISHPNITLIIGGRDQAKVDHLVSELGPASKPFSLDVNNPAELDAFCKQCDIVINCTGPSIVFGEKVGLAALKNNCHFIEPGGYEYLLEKLAGYQKEIQEKNLYFILSCGWIPGISEIFVRHAHGLAKQRMDSLEKLEHFYGDRNEWSESGLKDIIWHVHQTSKKGIKGMGVYRKGIWKPLTFGQPFSIEVDLPAPIGKQKAYYNFADELRQFVGENQEYGEIGSYSIQMSSKTMFAMFTIGLFCRKNEAKAMQTLKRAFSEDCRQNRRGGGVVVRIQGTKSNVKQILTGSFFENKPYWLTGITPVIAAKMIIGNQMKHIGANYFCNAAEPAVFMGLLAKAGLPYQFSLNDEYLAVEGE